jgi:multiple sugar transport system substrate-binding protein
MVRRRRSAVGALFLILAASTATAAQEPLRLQHWSSLTASDGEVWAQMIDAFNEAHTDVQIDMEVMTSEELDTQLLAGVASGRAPDFGWAYGGRRAQFITDEVIVPLDDLATEAGLDLADFTEASLNSARYPSFDNGLYMIPMDALTMANLINVDHATAAGLDVSAPPATGDEFIEWSKAMTVKEGDSPHDGVVLGYGVGASEMWGMVAQQMGFRRASEDLTTACVNPDAGKAALQWVADLFDVHQVGSRDVADIYKAFGEQEGSQLWIGPWIVHSFIEQGVNFIAAPIPVVGSEPASYGEYGGLEIYRQTDPARYAATMDAIKWLSDNSFLWTTVGRGAATRQSILDRPDYATAGLPPEHRQAFLDALATATVSPIPVKASEEFQIYSSDNAHAQAVDAVLAGEKTVDQAVDDVCAHWQELLDAE